MEVTSLCELPVASLLWQPRPGAWMLTFVCKATYELQPGVSPLAPTHDPIYEADQHWSNDPAWSVYAPRDIVPIRPRADVVLVGYAFAKGQTPVRSLVARVVVGDVDKCIEVWCDRWIMADGKLHEGQPFARMPLVYERAAGGPETANPVGIRPDARDRYGKRDLPNLMAAGSGGTSTNDQIEIAGFGPIGPRWSPRQRKLGRHAAVWDEGTFHHQPLPQDIDASYFNVAPPDQQTATLHCDERIVLENLHREHGRLVTTLSGHVPQAFVKRPGQAPQAAQMRPDLLWIHTDRGVCTLTFRGQIPLEHPLEKGTVQITLAEPAQEVTREEIEPAEIVDEDTSPGSEGARITLMGDPPMEPVSSEPPRSSGTMHNIVIETPSVAPTFLPFAPTARAAPTPTHTNVPELRLAGTPFTATTAPGVIAIPKLPPTAPPPPMAQAPILPPLAAPRPSPFPIGAPPPPPPPQSQPPPPPPKTESPWAANATRSSTTGAAAAPAIMAAVAPISLGVAIVPAVIPHSSGPAASQGSATAASNAAADAGAAWLIPRHDPYRPSVLQPLAPLQQPEVREVLQLIWFDPSAIPRVRRQPAWKRILDELEDEPPDADLDDAGSSLQPVDIEDRRAIFDILARGLPLDETGIQESLAAGAREDGKFASPIKLIAGELSFPFDELETLKATVAAVTPLVGNDEQLRAAVTNAQDLLKVPDLRTAPAVVESLTFRIRDTFSQGKRSVPPTYLDTQVERVLLEQRHYQRRAVFGGPHLRALLTPSGSSQAVPSYMPDALAQKLPMYQRFKARVIAEIYPQLDQYETHPTGLRVIALARSLPPMVSPAR